MYVNANSRRAFLKRFAAAAVGVSVAGVAGVARAFDAPTPAERPLGLPRWDTIRTEIVSEKWAPDGRSGVVTMCFTLERQGVPVARHAAKINTTRVGYTVSA